MALHIVIVGAGVIGASTAMHAAALGARVTVIDREYPAAGSSSLSLGVFNRQTPHPQELELRIRSIELLGRLQAQDDLPLERHGYLRLARREEDLERLRAALGIQREHGYVDGRLLDAAGIGELVPHMRTDDVCGALYGSDDGTFDGHLVCAAYLARAAADGAVLRVRTELLDIDRGGDVLTLATTAGAIECDRVVNAAGPWAARVGEISVPPARSTTSATRSRWPNSLDP